MCIRDRSRAARSAEDAEAFGGCDREDHIAVKPIMCRKNVEYMQKARHHVTCLLYTSSYAGKSRRRSPMLVPVTLALWLSCRMPIQVTPCVPLQAVSYTHLDVYKRQVLPKSIESRICNHLSFLLNVITAWHIKTNTREKQPPPNSDAPVSYTHLDVYKRQL